MVPSGSAAAASAVCVAAGTAVGSTTAVGVVGASMGSAVGGAVGATVVTIVGSRVGATGCGDGAALQPARTSSSSARLYRTNTVRGEYALAICARQLTGVERA